MKRVRWLAVTLLDADGQEIPTKLPQFASFIEHDGKVQMVGGLAFTAVGDCNVCAVHVDGYPPVLINP